ncbi:unnamed protein product [Meganyctiphanes norvegica]|uniref:Reverse transcriptase domain-containing protein n=1 Tax=Meganyctiphanes norvegica TaxID=48144 RepID=A0AAV2PT26_MEGNR
MHNRINYKGPSFPTFHTLNSETKPDCVLSNNKFFFNHHITSAGIGPSDHITMDIQISVNPISIPCTPIQDEKNTNWEEYKRRLEVLPEINLDGRNILDLHNEFSKLFSDITNAKNASTPIKTFTKKNNLKTTTKFKRLTKILNRYHNALMTNGLTNHLSVAIRNTQLLLIQEGNVCKEEWWQAQLAKVELAAKCNIKFWKRINHLSGRKKAHVPPLKYDLNGTEQTAKTDEEKENLFTNILKQACRISPEENTDYCQNNERRVKEELQSKTNELTTEWIINLDEIRDNSNRLPFNNLDILTTIKSLKNRAPGPTGLRKPFFSNLPPNIISNLCHLFNCCYAAGIYPNHFKTAEIIMIPKNTAPSANPEKYRPISLLNFMGKIFAKLLNNMLIKQFERNHTLKDSQHGFRKKRGTTTLLANLYERISREKGTDRRTLITMVTRDVKKAFDKAWHAAITCKLLRAGIQPKLVRIITNFLHARKAYVKVNKHKGDTFNLEAGVPQGDVLSPTLFLIIGNDFPNQPETVVKETSRCSMQMTLPK